MLGQGLKMEPSELLNGKLPIAILEQRSIPTHDYLVITQSSCQPAWVSQEELQDAAPLLLDYYRHQDFTPGDDLLQVCSSQMINEKIFDQYRYPQGDFFFPAQKFTKIEKKISIKAFSFEAVNSREQLAARALYAPPPITEYYDFYMQINKQFYSMQTPPSVKNSCSWTVGLSPVLLLKECYQMRMTPLAVYGLPYFDIARELQKYGLISTEDSGLLADIYFLQRKQPPNKFCKAIVSYGVCDIQSTILRRLLILEKAEYSKQYADFLCVETQEDFAFIELSNLANVLQYKTSEQTLFRKIDENIQEYGSQCYIFKYNMTFAEAVRQQTFLENDRVAERVIGEHERGVKDKYQIKNDSEWLNAHNYIIGRLLTCLWQCEHDVIALGERKQLISQITRALMQQKVQALMLVVPDNMYGMTTNFIEEEYINSEFFNIVHNDIFMEFNEQTSHFIILTESQIVAYYLVVLKNRSFISKHSLAQFVLFPFCSTRNIEYYTQEVYFYSGAQTPCCFSIVCNESIEEEIMVFRERMSAESEREMQSLLKKTLGFKEQNVQLYEEIMELIEQKGFDGNWIENQYNWSDRIQIAHPQEEDKELEEFREVNNYNYNTMILQSALGALFHINPSCNINVLMRNLLSCKNSDSLNTVQQSVTISNNNSELYEIFNFQNVKGRNGLVKLPNIEESQVQINDAFDKMLNQESNNNNEAANVIFNFLESGQQYGGSDVLYYDNGKRVQSYIYLPIVKLQSGTEFSEIKEISTDEGEEQSVITESNDELLIGNLLNCTVNEVDFVENQQLSVVQYRGSENDNQIIIKEKQLLFEHVEEITEVLNKCPNNESDKLKCFIAALNLVDTLRFFCDFGIYQGFNFQNTAFPKQWVVNYIIQDAMHKNSQAFDEIIDADQIVEYCSPYELYPISETILTIKKKYNLIFSTSLKILYDEIINEDINNIYGHFIINYIKEERIQSLAEMFNEFNYFQLISAMIREAKSNEKILDTPVFNTNCISENELILLVKISLSQEEEKWANELIKTELSEQQLFENDNSAFVLHRCFSESLKIISCCSVYSEMQEEKLVDAYKSLLLQRNSQKLLKVLSTGFDIPSFYRGLYFPPQSKKFLSKDIVYEEYTENAPSCEIINSTSQKKEDSEEQSEYLNQKIINTNYNPNKSFIPDKNMDNNYGQPEIAQFIPDKTDDGPIVIPKLNFLGIQKYDEENVQIPTSSLSTNMEFCKAYIDQVIINLSKEIFINAMKRIMNHYSCRSYYFHNNLLYVPEIAIIKSEDAFKHELGLNVKYYEESEADSNFPVLLRVLLNEFERENNLKESNIHKFCTIFNETIKNELEQIASLPELDMDFYKQILVFYEWLLKRTIEAECDLEKENLIVFKQDPVLGIGMDSINEELPQDKLKFAHNTDELIVNEEALENDANEPAISLNSSIIVSQPSRDVQSAESSSSALDIQVDALYNSYVSFLQTINPEYLQKQLIMLVKIGLGTGSSPLEVFYRFIQKDDPYKVCKILQTLTSLITLCCYHNRQFPLKVKGISESRGDLLSTLARLEHMRFLHIKLQQFDFLVWLERLQSFRHDSMTTGETEMIYSVMQRQMTCNYCQLYGDAMVGYSAEEKQIAQQVGGIAGEIDQLNTAIWNIERKYQEFLGENDPDYSLLKGFKLDRFCINDFNQTGLVESYKTVAQFKLVFIMLFGTSKERVMEVLRGESQEQPVVEQNKIIVKFIYDTIGRFFDRLHDFILCHLVSDMGYTEAMMGSIISKDQRPKSKHVEFLRNSIFVDELIENNVLIDILEEVREQQPSLQDDICKNLDLSTLLRCNIAFKLPSDAQIITAINKLRMIDPQTIFRVKSVDKALLSRRVEEIALALRYERIISCDPLEKYLKDKTVDVLSAVEDQATKREEVIEYQSGKTSRQQQDAKSFLAQEAKQPTNDYRPSSPPINFVETNATPISNYQLAQLPEEPQMYEEEQQEQQPEATEVQQYSFNISAAEQTSFAAGVAQQEQDSERYRSAEWPMREATYKNPYPKFSIALNFTETNQKLIENMKLSIFKDEVSEVIDTITDLIPTEAGTDQIVITKQLDEYMFYMSTCQQLYADAFGRMYTWLCNFNILQEEELLGELKHEILEIMDSRPLISNSHELFTHLNEEFDERGVKLLQTVLDLGFYHANVIRDILINQPKQDLTKFKRNIEEYLSLFTLFVPEYETLVLNNVMNKRKLAMCNYFYMCQNLE